MTVKIERFILPLLFLLSLGTWFVYKNLLFPQFLTFSDTAKFADLAKNMVLERGYVRSFSFFSTILSQTNDGFFLVRTLPFYPLLIFIGFKLLGISDFTVLLTSGLFYFGSVIFLYLLGKKMFGTLVGFLAGLALVFDPSMLNYALTGASESMFIFELILIAYFFTLNSKKTIFLGLIIMLFSYFTRPSAIIYIAGFILYLILLRSKKVSQIFKAVGFLSLFWIIMEIFLTKFSGKFFLYSPFISFFHATSSFSPAEASTTYLRGGGDALITGIRPLISKLFYNFYNFYKLLPQIFSPYLIVLFLLSYFKKGKSREENVFKFIVLLLAVITIFSAAATLPIFRYLHPIIPFMYLLGIDMLVWILSKLFSNKEKLIVISCSLVIFLFVGQTVGKILLDSRFVKSHNNTGMPPVYVRLSKILKENTNPHDLVVTNLDTWGSWYGDRKTLWFPIKPAQLTLSNNGQLKIDAIYLTSYKMDDENYYMGEEWRQIFLNPQNAKDEYILKNYEFVKFFEVKPEETYEKEGATAVLLKKK